MRILLKTHSFIAKMYFVELQGNSIVGWFANDWLRHELGLPKGTHFDAHFTYPADGNYHFSYKSMNPDYEEYVSVYWDKVKIKKIVKHEPHKEERKRNEIEPPILTHMVPIAKPQPMDQIRFYQFVSGSFNVRKGAFPLLGADRDLVVPENDIWDDDLLVDVRPYEDSEINISAFIRHTDDPFPPVPNAERFQISLPLPGSRILELACLIEPNTPIPPVEAI